VAAVFLPLVLGMAAVVVPEWRRAVLREWRTWLAAAALAAALIVPWFVYEHVKSGSAFWDVLFGVHVFKRMTVSIDPGHLHPWNYYLQQIWTVLVKTDTLPLVIAGTGLLLMQVVRRRDAHLLIALWAAVPLLLISTSPSKIYHYVSRGGARRLDVAPGEASARADREGFVRAARTGRDRARARRACGGRDPRPLASLAARRAAQRRGPSALDARLRAGRAGGAQRARRPAIDSLGRARTDAVARLPGDAAPVARREPSAAGGS
jgi:hypothetical protein